MKNERPVEERIALPQAAPPIVSEALAEAAVRRLDQNKAEATRNAKRDVLALLRGGYIRCGQCERTMRVHIGSPEKGRPFYYCPTQKDSVMPLGDRCTTARPPVHRIDAEVWGKVEHELRDPAFIRNELMRRHMDDTLTQNTLEMCEQRLAEIDRHLKNLANAVAQFDNPDDAAPFVQKAKDLNAQRRGILETQERAEKDRANISAWRDRIGVFEEWCRAFAKAADEGLITYELKRMALYMLEATVTVHEKGLEPVFTISFGTTVERPHERPSNKVPDLSDSDQMHL